MEFTEREKEMLKYALRMFAHAEAETRDEALALADRIHREGSN